MKTMRTLADVTFRSRVHLQDRHAREYYRTGDDLVGTKAGLGAGDGHIHLYAHEINGAAVMVSLTLSVPGARTDVVYVPIENVVQMRYLLSDEQEGQTEQGGPGDGGGSTPEPAIRNDDGGGGRKGRRRQVNTVPVDAPGPKRKP